MAKKNKNRSIAIGIIGLASLMGVATTGLVIGLSINGAKPNSAKTENQAIDWAQIANMKMVDSEFNFASANFAKGVLNITGDAEDADKRTQAFNIGKKAVLDKISEDNLGDKSGVLAFNNLITINGQKVEELPDATATLGDKPAAEACQSAYNTLLDDRVINFNSGSAIISEDSKGLLNALSDVAIRCIDYSVEVGGHTDLKGDAGANIALSERRAQVVADYLVEKGVSASEITVKGYGETVPLDTTKSAEADAKNRRIEFKISEKLE